MCCVFQEMCIHLLCHSPYENTLSQRQLFQKQGGICVTYLAATAFPSPAVICRHPSSSSKSAFPHCQFFMLSCSPKSREALKHGEHSLLHLRVDMVQEKLTNLQSSAAVSTHANSFHFQFTVYKLQSGFLLWKLKPWQKCLGFLSREQRY